MSSEEFKDLAWGLVYGKLSAEERELALHLVSQDPEFLEALKMELELKQRLAHLKRAMPEEAKERVYAAITGSRSQVLVTAVLKTVLETTLPRMLWPVLQILERSVFAGEQQ